MSAFSDLQSSLQVFLEQDTCHFVVAYSGGVDSEVLLHATHQMLSNYPQHRLSAIHVNHGLSPLADEWAEHCQSRCQSLGIKLYLVHVEVSGKDGIEASAREARYQAFTDRLPTNSVILLAQHQDDQFETLLLQLKRGAGPKGLAAMPQQYLAPAGQRFVRPLLDLPRENIVDYASQHGLSWVEDESNQDVRFERNFLRKQVIPVLKNRWPNITQAASRSAALCAEQQALLDEESHKHLRGLQTENNTLNLSGLLEFSDQWIAQIIRYWLSQQDIRSPSAQIMQEIKKLLVAAEDANPVVRWNNWQLRRFNGQLYLLPLSDEQHNAHMDLVSGAEFYLADKSLHLTLTEQSFDSPTCLDLSVTQGKIDIVFDGFSQRFKPQGVAHSKPLKQWFKTWAVPPWERTGSPQIYLNGKLIAVWVNRKWIVEAQHVASGGLFLQANCKK